MITLILVGPLTWITIQQDYPTKCVQTKITLDWERKTTPNLEVA